MKLEGGRAAFREVCSWKTVKKNCLPSKARRALCVRGLFRKVIGPGSRAMHISGWLAFEMERSRGTISVSQDRSGDRLRRLTRIFFFFLREPEEEKETRGVDAYPFGRKSILGRSTLPQVRFSVFLSSSPT